MTDTRTRFSPDRAYRYCLWRVWGNLDADEPYMAVIGLNPSIADEQIDDPTIRRCINFAKREKMAALCMLNIFAFAATDPKVMKRAPDPVGPDWAHHFDRCVSGASIIVCAWGTHGSYQGRGRSIGERLIQLKGYDSIKCLVKTKDGHPKHPLYIRADQPLTPFTP